MAFVQIVDTDFAESYVRQKITDALLAHDDSESMSEDVSEVGSCVGTSDGGAPSTTVCESSSDEEESKYVTEFVYVNAEASDVKLAGDWNEWIPCEMKLIDDKELWYATVRVTAGKKQFKFIVDGEWVSCNMHPTEHGKNFRVVDGKKARKSPDEDGDAEESEGTCREKKGCCTLM